MINIWKLFDGSVGRIKKADLRNYCPCAECIAEKEEHGAKYIPIYSDEQLSIKSISLVGSYAISIVWKDGHSNGIYDFHLLKKITNKNNSE